MKCGVRGAETSRGPSDCVDEDRSVIGHALSLREVVIIQ